MQEVNGWDQFCLHDLVFEGKLSVMHSLRRGGKISCHNFIVHSRFSQDVSAKSWCSPIPSPPLQDLGNLALDLSFESFKLSLKTGHH